MTMVVAATSTLSSGATEWQSLKRPAAANRRCSCRRPLSRALPYLAGEGHSLAVWLSGWLVAADVIIHGSSGIGH